MSTIVTRAGKGSPLTHNEVDANFNNLNSDKYQSGDSPSFVTVTASTYASGSWNGSTIGVGYGGTGQTTYTNGQLLIGNTTGNTLTKATLTAGSGISITNGSGSITIATTGGGGSTIGLTADVSSTSALYPTFAATATGTTSSLYTSDPRLNYRPSTGEFQADYLQANGGILLQGATAKSSLTIAAGVNGLTVTPYTIPPSVAITVAAGQRWVML